MSAGILVALAALALWGFWGFASQRAVQEAHPMTVQWLSAIPQTLLGPLWYYLSLSRTSTPHPSLRTVLWTFAACSSAILAMLCYSWALKLERASVVVAISSAYPLFTIVLLVLTGTERMQLQQILGFVLVVSGLIVLQLSPT